MKGLRRVLAVILASLITLSVFPLSAVARWSESFGELAREVVGEGIVLLKNDNNALPLSSNRTLALFGNAQLYSPNWSQGFNFGGGGSGNMYIDYTPEGPADVLISLAEEGRLSVYEPLTEAYKNDLSYIPDNEMYNAAAAAADTAVVYIRRMSGEGNDMSVSSWDLTSNEKTMLTKVSELFETVIVFINAPNPMSTDWSLDGNDYGIDVDALLVCYMPGEYGPYGMADIMLGDVNPSGKLVDSYAYDIYDYPSTESIVNDDYDTDYTEDIYVGYRYFETFDIPVVYEFGFGLSYTTFDIKTDSVVNDGTNITAKVTVTNTGNVAGKEVVQVYYSAPQKDEGDAVLSKSAIDLAAFKKTKLLAAGESQTLEISFAVNDMASFDDTGASGHESCYVLEAGDYDVLIGNSVKNVEVGLTFNIPELIVTKQLSEYGDVTLESRLEADGSYTDPSVSATKEGQIYVSHNKVTTVEGEAAYNIPTAMKTEGYTDGWITDGFKWHNFGSGTVLGNFKNAVGKYVYYDLLIKKEGTYSLGFVTSNGNKAGASEEICAEDIFTIEVSSDSGASWTQIDGFAYDSPNTSAIYSITGNYWYNFAYNTQDLNGNSYKAQLPKGNVLMRFKVGESAGEGYCNTNIDKFFIIPEGMEYTVRDVCRSYGAQPLIAVCGSEETWIDGEEVSSYSGLDVQEFDKSQGYLYNGEEYVSIKAGSTLNGFQGSSGKYADYTLNIETAGNYNIGLIASNSNESLAEDIIEISISYDGGASFTKLSNSVDLNSTLSDETKEGSLNFYYSDTDSSGNKYTLTLPTGEVVLRFSNTQNAAAVDGVIGIEKFVVVPESKEFGNVDVYKYYAIPYSNYISSSEATWFEGEAYNSSANRVGTESFAEGKGFLNDGENYVSIPAGEVVGFFDKEENGYCEYTFGVEKSGYYNIGFVAGRGSNNDSTGGQDILDISVSSDGGVNWVKAETSLDVIHTANVGTAAKWWNFYYNDADFDGNEYKVYLNKGIVTLRFTNTENSRSCGGPNIDKFVLIPEGKSVSQEEVNIQYGISSTSGIASDKATWIQGEDYSAVSGTVKYEEFNSEQGFFYNGSSFVSIPAGRVVGFFDKAVGNYAEYTLYINKAGRYTIGFSSSNGSSAADLNDATEVLAVAVSSGQESWSEAVNIDSRNTRKVGTAAMYWNFMYSDSDLDGNKYEIELPAGEVTLRFTSLENATKGGAINIDRFVLIPSGVEYTSEDAVEYYNQIIKESNRVSVDFDADNYTGIKYENIVSGEATWDEFLAQMSYNELIDLSGGHNGEWHRGYTGMIGFSSDDVAEKYGIYTADTADGPAGIRTTNYKSTWWPNATLQASTFNPELIEKIGLAVGEEALYNMVDIWLAPGMNIHRSPLCGRNFEYYSEDPVVTGVIASAITKGVQSKGIAITIKHVCVNNRDLNRKLQDSRVSEKALREIYLKGFEMVIEEANPWCLMTSYNKLNGVYTSTNSGLINTIIRGEWNYDGLIMSDWTTTPEHLDELNAGNNAKMVKLDAEALRAAVESGELTRETLEENAYYILSNIAKFVDTAVNPYKVHEIAKTGTTTVLTREFAKKTGVSRFVVSGDYFDAYGSVAGDFFEYNINCAQKGTYTLSLDYATETSVTDAYQIYLNGELVETADNDVSSTTDTATMQTKQVVDLSLEKGKSVIRIVHNTSTDIYYRSFSLSRDAQQVFGDINGDGEMNVVDLAVLKKVVAGLSSEDSEEIVNSTDINEDGETNLIDLAELKKCIAGLE